MKARLIFEFDESSVFPIQTGGSHIFQVSSLSYTRGKISFARSRKSCKKFEIILIRSKVMGKTFNFEHCPSTVNHLQSLSKRNFWWIHVVEASFPAEMWSRSHAVLCSACIAKLNGTIFELHHARPRRLRPRSIKPTEMQFWKNKNKDNPLKKSFEFSY